LKKTVSILMALAMLLSFAACGEKTTPAGEYTGTVKSVDGSKITLTVDGSDYSFTVTDATAYTMSMPEMPGGSFDGGERPEMPEGAEMPEKPEGDFDPAATTEGEKPAMPEGMELPEGGERPEMPDGGELPEGAEMPEGAERPEKPEGGNMPDGGFELSAAMITVGSTVTVTIGSDGTASTVSFSMGGFGGK